MENILFAILSLIVGIVIGCGLFYAILANKTSKSMKNANKLIEDAKKEAVDKLTELADIMEKESATEQLLASKGFEDAVVSIGEDSVDVVLNYEELSSSDRAQIEDIVTRKTGYSVSQLVISKMQTTES